MARKKAETLRSKYDAFLNDHPLVGDAIVCTSVAAALVGLFLFVAFSGFGSSAEFIYNQF